MEKLKMHSPDITGQNIARIAELFPNCVTEAANAKGEVTKTIDFDLLKQELSDSIVEGPRERYQLDWPGKRDSLLAANAPIAKTLRPARAESADFEKTKNIFVEGDNLDALKLLEEGLLASVKVIYIDPPYNTGKDFLYDDNFTQDAEAYFRDSQQLGGDGERMIANLDGSGRFHSDWLSMIYPRLKLARNLLRDDGLLFVSIDDNEYANLRRVCDEVFGSENYMATLQVKVRYEGKTLVEDMDFQKLVEQVLVYRRSRASKLRKKQVAYSFEKFRWRITANGNHKTVDLGGREVEIYPPGEYAIEECEPSEHGLKEIWATGKILDGNSSGRFFRDHIAGRAAEDGLGVLYKVPGIGDDSSPFRYFTGPRREGATKGKYFQGVPGDVLAGERDSKEAPIVTYYDMADSFGNCRHEGGIDFRDGKKPVRFLRTLLNMVDLQEGDLVCDFFAGSCSLAHTVLEYQVESGIDLRFLVIQVPQKVSPDSDAFKAGFHTIAELGKERIRKAGNKIKEENATTAPNLDVGFRVLKVDTSNMKDVYYNPDEVEQSDLLDHIENIKEDRTSEDLLFQVLLDWGVDLSLPIKEEEIEGKTVFFVDENALAACFDKDLSEELVKKLAERKPLRAVFRDSGYKTDSVKINVEQIFKLLSPSTEVKSI